MAGHENRDLWIKLFIYLLVAFAGSVLHAQPQDTVTYVYTDPQGTPLAEADAHGNITKTYEYTPYGTYAPQGTSAPAPAPQGPAYTGHVNDPETNLVYMQARYYDPATGRFLSIDPVAPTGGDTFNFNRYAYVDNNPIVRTDPNGRESASLTLQGLSAIEQDQAQQPPGEVAQAQSVILGAVPGVGDIQSIHDAYQDPTGINISAAIIGLVPDGGALVGKVLKEVKVAKEAAPLIKAGAAGGDTAGKAFPRAVKNAAKAENPTATCVFCRREGTATQVDHAIPKARGGNATLENAQLACSHCNASKGARDLPVNPPPDYKGPWPPSSPPPPHQ
ncbi:RHS repeat-associated core domain-containing protein [Dyella nitratireducens]|uniref:HNH nuclease domain-containing protein n=1 Tax=Dyella nitratireducens TaxID=1849580 RepID=A0ABQ1GXS9_9GAMM|nr:RHS repeat-associated core domain-containing protein [Dyella nitratireducens]GGA52555.1 hypothetical protein GCM10010981_47540 [Dyella nitratireducens]GLQ41555.1 hypothetical protein GCM10007902_14050 [Dyella nitratireducens]